MKAPIFILCADQEVLAYADPSQALKYAESPDVESGEYIAVFDAEGRRFKLDVVEPTRTKKMWFITTIRLTRVAFKALEDKPTGADELRAMLIKQLPSVATDIPLSELVRLAAAKLRSP